mmetsp:Transcript_37278/g.59879  ORF Transcript_37278/g.59879 Transcript_37278/m.59879 type:complete len:93 (+) Transcript_37278:571-849(+)
MAAYLADSGEREAICGYHHFMLTQQLQGGRCFPGGSIAHRKCLQCTQGKGRDTSYNEDSGFLVKKTEAAAADCRFAAAYFHNPLLNLAVPHY